MSPDKPYRYPYLKLFSREWLEGSLRFDCTPAERGTWADLLAMANESRTRGVIQANPTTPYPHSWIADKLRIPLGEFETALEKFKISGRISENSTGITIINFKFYQEELYKKRGRPPKYPSHDKVNDPERFVKGKYGHMVYRGFEENNEHGPTIEEIQNQLKNNEKETEDEK